MVMYWSTTYLSHYRERDFRALLLNLGQNFKGFSETTLIPKQKHIFANPDEAKLLYWHSHKHKHDRKLRHVVVSPQKEYIDYKFHILVE